MDIQATKLELMQYLLKTNKESLLMKMKELFLNDNDFDALHSERELSPMSIEEFNKRIDKSENDFKNGKFTSSETLLSKYI